jgi:hypothetical protein
MEAISLELCDECGCSVSWGSGNYVNRIPANDGWLCPECQCIECDNCGKLALEVDQPPHDDTLFFCDECL